MALKIGPGVATQNVLNALTQLYPHRRFTLGSLKPPRLEDLNWVLCAHDKAGFSVICKTGARDDAAVDRLHQQFNRQTEMAAYFQTERLRLPNPLHFDHRNNVFVMEDAKGRDLRQVWSKRKTIAENRRLFRKSGEWLAQFHAPSARISAFDPAPLLNWFKKTNCASLADDAQYQALTDSLTTLAAQADGKPTRRAITHRDFHLGNLILNRDGILFGIDFGNHQEDEAMRDMVSFAMDALTRWNGNPAPPDAFTTVFQAFSKGCNSQEIAPQVRLFFQRMQALVDWRNMSGLTPLTQARQQKIDILRSLALASDPII